MRGGGEQASDEDLEPLKLQRYRARPSTAAVVAADAGHAGRRLRRLAGLRARSWSGPGPALGLPAAVVALLLSPIATELPETMNAIIWVRQGKAELALANISGAMMIQATVPTAIGLLLHALALRHPARARRASRPWPRSPTCSSCCASAG